MHKFKEKHKRKIKVLKEIRRNIVHIYKVLLDSTCILKYYVVLTNFYNFLSVLTLEKTHRYSVHGRIPCSCIIIQQQQKHESLKGFEFFL